MALYLKICLCAQNESYLHVKFFIIRHFTGPFTILSSKQMQRIVSMESNKAAQCKFLKHIYWNFMESVISKIEIGLNL